MRISEEVGKLFIAERLQEWGSLGVCVSEPWSSAWECAYTHFTRGHAGGLHTTHALHLFSSSSSFAHAARASSIVLYRSASCRRPSSSSSSIVTTFVGSSFGTRPYSSPYRLSNHHAVACQLLSEALRMVWMRATLHSASALFIATENTDFSLCHVRKVS